MKLSKSQSSMLFLDFIAKILLKAIQMHGYITVHVTETWANQTADSQFAEALYPKNHQSSDALGHSSAPQFPTAF